ncbi:hypothetical protein CEAn_00766 [Coxiella endosymbiont of Amblyomma nuttalli]|nr:hypothetical protein CEAn_00766 [Coxiella endosymbiont of Amblyomma nuttalli]
MITGYKLKKCYCLLNKTGSMIPEALPVTTFMCLRLNMVEMLLKSTVRMMDHQIGRQSIRSILRCILKSRR